MYLIDISSVLLNSYMKFNIIKLIILFHLSGNQ